ncbi:MAG: 5,6-dimethylbenzimidazole synthase [Candidatus Nitrosotenuis sp.]|jgi:5,6-dimethylbenzimidazole synthase|uniref:5,6-dimethylbenzimidazole synthase n=1 Tax=Candidatus Nitrosotenuis cloacae TaxID=1603555 RepID=UPI002281343B|nr:5,6-dimethylbenzimidazole synthase [Candidatus Nitrosotenuis cloacae]MDC8438013.1 5,6-dimethylbenzimidazole synthase [Candidatus Nitrosotenuis sp.]
MSEFSDQEKSGLYKAIYTRRDVRSHFNTKPIDDEALARILSAAHHAPSVGFSQPWNFVLIRDSATKEQVKKSFEEERLRSSKQVEEEKKDKYMSLKLEGISESDVNICITYDPTRFGPFVIGRSSIPETGIYSVCCAVQNLWLAARSEEIGVGWVSILSNEALKKVLGLPEHIIPVAYLCLGHVSEFAERPDLETAKWLPRLELKDVVYFEKWGQTKPNPIWEQIYELVRANFDYAFK